MNPTIMGQPRIRRGDYDIVPYQSTHNTGGTIMGTDPKTSVVNRYLQSWDASNCSSWARPRSRSSRPTIRPARSGALAYWSAEAIVTKYLKSPGPLVPA